MMALLCGCRGADVSGGGEWQFVARLLEDEPVRLLDAAEVLAAGDDNWKVELDSEVRNARLAVPNEPIVWPVEVPSRARLRFGVGVDRRARSPLVFRVSLASSEIEEKVVLFEQPLDPSRRNDAGRWHDHEVELSRFGGVQATVTLEVRANGDSASSAGGLGYWANPEILARVSALPEPNVVLISIDTLRADHLGLYGYTRETTPYLDTWAREHAVVFENAVASSPWTIPSHLSMFSGLNASNHGVNHRAPVPQEFRLMAELLRRHGYSTGAVTGGGFLDPKLGFAQGFDRYRYWPEPKSAEEIAHGVDRAIEWLEEHRDRRF